MSKKKFDSGLDSVFSAEKDDKIRVGSAFLMSDDSTSEVQVKPVERRAANNTHKNFLSDLDFLLQEALQDGFDDLNRGGSSAISSAKSKSVAPTASDSRAFSGIDSLIRQTVDIGAIEQDELGKKRISFSVDRTKLDKLKTIARLEKAYLKDVLSKLIDEHIQKYIADKGLEL